MDKLILIRGRFPEYIDFLDRFDSCLKGEAYFVATDSELIEALATANWRDDAIKRLESKIVELSNQVGKKGSRKAKNKERLAEIERCRLKIGKIKSI